MLTKSADIEMRSEDLYISRDEIKVRYSFYSNSATEVRTLVAFPMPEISPPSDPAEDVSSKLEDLEFVTRVNGQPIQTQVEKKAIANGVDQAQVLLRLGVPLYPGEAQETLDKLPQNTIEELIRLGLVKEQGEGGPLSVNWTLRVNYYWEQVFPPRTELVIDHRYKPIVGGTIPLSPIALRNELRESFYRPYCIDDEFLNSIRRAGYVN